MSNLSIHAKQNLALMLQAAKRHASEMMHPAAGKLVHPYLDPGGPYSKTLWDWDSFWSSRALLGVADVTADAEFKKFVLTYAKGALLNFVENQGEDGAMPILISDFDCDWFDSLSDRRNNICKPVSGQFADLLDRHGALETEEKEQILDALVKLAKCRIDRYRDKPTGLQVWANDIAIGVDDDPTVWGRAPFSSAHIYLNAFCVADWRASAQFALRCGQFDRAEFFSGIASELAVAMEQYLWDPVDQMYYSADVDCRQRVIDNRHFGKLNVFAEPDWHCLPLKIKTWSGFLPLAFQMVSQERADSVIRKYWLEGDTFRCNGGIRTLSMTERMYDPSSSRGNPSNWRGPVWIVSNYLVYEALRNYGYRAAASELAEKTLKLLADDYRANGHFHEYYHPDSCEGISGPGFLNWNLLACLMGEQS